MTDLELKHYGVKGMRWGVRKDRDPNTRKGKNYIHTFLKINGSDDVYDSFKTPGGFYKSAYLDDKKHKIKYKYDYTHDYRPY